MDNLLNIKKYNHMDSLNTPIQGFILWPLNTLNFAVGMVANADLNFISALIGIILNLMWHFYKLYRQIKIDDKADAVTDFDHDTLKLTCPNCKNVYETTSPTQIFCTPECRQVFNADAYSRRP